MKYIIILHKISFILLISQGCKQVNEPAMIEESPYSITFMSNRDNNRDEGAYDIFIMDGNGNNVKKLTNGDLHNSDPSFAKDGLNVYFQSIHGDNINIHSVDLNGNNLTNITNMELSNAEYNLSNDGSKITFCHGNRYKFSREIYVMNLDGSNKILLSEGTKWQGNHTPFFTYDDSKIVFISHNLHGSDIKGYSDIYCVNTDGSNLTNLTNQIGYNYFLIASPYEDIIVYSSYDTSQIIQDLYSIKLSNQNKKRITHNNNSRVTPKFFLNSGKSILFSIIMSFTSTTSIIDLDGKNLRTLPIEGSVYDISPDERYIVIEQPPHSSVSNIFIANIDGKNLNQITNNNYSDKNPIFSPNLVKRP